MTGQINNQQTNTPPGVKDEVVISCATCMFWAEGENGRTGECRRHAPPARSTEKMTGAYALWPLTEPDQWCGEWRQSPDASNA